MGKSYTDDEIVQFNYGRYIIQWFPFDNAFLAYDRFSGELIYDYEYRHDDETYLDSKEDIKNYIKFRDKKKINESICCLCGEKISFKHRPVFQFEDNSFVGNVRYPLCTECGNKIRKQIFKNICWKK